MSDTFTFAGSSDQTFLGSDCVNLVSSNTNSNAPFGPDVFTTEDIAETQVASISDSGGYLHIEIDDAGVDGVAGNFIVLYNNTAAQNPLAGVHLITSTFNSGVDLITNTEYLDCFDDITEANMSVAFLASGLTATVADEHFVGAGSVCVSNTATDNNRFRTYYELNYTNCWLDFVNGTTRCSVTTDATTLTADSEYTAPKAHFIAGVCAPTAHSI